jgi:hypothetical protein
VWRSTRHKAALYAMGGVAAALAACLVLEWAVVTEYEEIENALDEAAEAVEAGDVQGVLAFLAPPPEAEALRNLVERYLPDYPVKKFTFDKPRVEFIEGDGRRYAEVKVWIKIYLQDPKQVEGRDPLPDELTLKVRQTGDRWEVVEFRSRLLGGNL